MFPIFFASLNDDERQTAEALYLKYEKPLYLCAYRITGDRQYAEDSVNDAFLAFINNSDRIEKREASYALFLFTACRSAACKYRSIISGYKEILVADPDCISGRKETDDEYAPLLGHPDDAIRSSLENEYRRLTDEERILLILRLAFNFDYKTVSQIMGKSSSALRTAYSRLIRKLRKVVHV